MDIDFKLLRGFVELAREGSFTRAAARLGMSQPALTVQIRKLEAELGFTLFSRSTRALALTPEGQEFVALAERVIEEHAAALAGARRIRAGGHETLRIGAASYTAEITERSQLIEQFRIQRPHCALRVNTMRQVAILQALRRGALDVAIIIGVGMARELYDAQLADGQANEGGYPLDLPIAAIQSRPFCLRAPPEWVLSKRRAVHSSELKGKELIMIDIEHSAEVLGAMAAFFREAGAHIVFAPGGGHVDAMRCGAKRRTPIVSLGWFDALEKETAPDFVPVAITDCPRKVDLVVLRAAGEVRPPAAHFIEQAVTLLGPPPEAEGRAAAEHPLGR